MNDKITIFELEEGIVYKKTGFRNQHSKYVFKRENNMLFMKTDYTKWTQSLNTKTKDVFGVVKNVL